MGLFIACLLPPLATAGATMAAYIFSDSGISPLTFARMIMGFEYHAAP